MQINLLEVFSVLYRPLAASGGKENDTHARTHTHMMLSVSLFIKQSTETLFKLKIS